MKTVIMAIAVGSMFIINFAWVIWIIYTDKQQFEAKNKKEAQNKA